ncbi:hypothetical protein COHA_007455 [Chlorella ohadii]|uniref:Peroxisome biogenesis protein 22 n=1 Tax=Chlorella ohadii TaxID=2649997 RepID=A0AAD5DL04_9CHLO|nr:hypothetical protein COHA_007455 [Chlorella ohadii]
MWRALVALLASLFRDASGPQLAFTGVLGLAVVYALWQLRGGAGRKRDEQPLHPSQPSTSAAAAAAHGGTAAAAAHHAAAATPAAAVARRLAGVRRVTLSVPGVLLEEKGAEELDESATVRQDAAELVRQIAGRADCYLMCHVSDDIGEALVRGALEHAGVTGSRPGQVPLHRLLFCGTLLGKVSIVRQLEPELHIDGHQQTVSDLQRFVKQLVLVGPPYLAQQAAAVPSGGPGLAGPNVQHAPSLAAAMGLPS